VVKNRVAILICQSIKENFLHHLDRKNPNIYRNYWGGDTFKEKRSELYTGCGKLTSFFEYEMPYKKGSELAAPCIYI
jgi:hypothetical protein